MKLIRLIADSGGTKTDWCGINDCGEKHTFTTESYHPLNIDEDFIVRQVDFWKQHDISECSLHFFCSGCLREENQLKLIDLFKQLGFKSQLVESDLFAAARVVYEDSQMTAICGTGSVLFKIEYEQLIELRGGLGWEKGDEGSGFYFGKLLIERLNKNKSAYPEIIEKLEEFKRLDELTDFINTPQSKGYFSKLPKLFSEFQSHPLIASVHLENVLLFLKLYAYEVTSIGFVGSYAFHNQQFFNMGCSLLNIRATAFIERPIERISNNLLTK